MNYQGLLLPLDKLKEFLNFKMWVSQLHFSLISYLWLNQISHTKFITFSCVYQKEKKSLIDYLLPI